MTTVFESTAAQLNADCRCVSLDQSLLERSLAAEFASGPVVHQLADNAIGRFAQQPVFVSAEHLSSMAEVVQAIESVVALPAFQSAVLPQAPAVVRTGPPGPRGVFFGYDFHLDHEHLSLIEINTNAGGAMLNAMLARAQRTACPSMDGLVPTIDSVERFEQAMVAMFQQEWHLAGHTRPLARIAIVDDDPLQQHLYPEFVLFRQLFERQGWHAVIADPRELRWERGRLCWDHRPIDLVYNRLTDFYLEHPDHEALRTAHDANAVVLTPHPRAHALYADKRLLAIFSDDAQLQALGAPASTRAVLGRHVPQTEVVSPAKADGLWARRRDLFFKPFSGFGSRAAYRGDKLTQRVWRDILAGQYVAQRLVTPGLRVIQNQEMVKNMKFDLRLYAYAGQAQWVAARLYQGQTTNFRTLGGGFAPVYSTPAESVFLTQRNL